MLSYLHYFLISVAELENPRIFAKGCFSKKCLTTSLQLVEIGSQNSQGTNICHLDWSTANLVVPVGNAHAASKQQRDAFGIS